jgi:hypothetical protein
MQTLEKPPSAGINGSQGIVSGKITLTVTIETNLTIPDTIAASLAEHLEGSILDSGEVASEGSDFLKIEVTGDATHSLEWDDRRIG